MGRNRKKRLQSGINTLEPAGLGRDDDDNLMLVTLKWWHLDVGDIRCWWQKHYVVFCPRVREK